MRIACPNCSAEYEVPDSLLASGPRLLRCARCGHQFQAKAGPDAPVPPPPAVPSPAPAADTGPEARPTPVLAPPLAPPDPDPPAPPQADLAPVATPTAERGPPAPAAGRAPPPLPPLPPWRPQAAEPAPRSGASLALAWLLSLAVLGAAGWATVHFHAEIVEAWPPAARLYAALGIR
jgi:predicted Zn finger-like uncharacterized protein